MSLSHFMPFEDIFFGKKNMSVLHHKFEKHIISEVYKGGPLGALSHEAKFKQDVKI